MKGKNMKQLTGNQVRQLFLDYFSSKGHSIEPGASLVPHNDPTLLWINAGVAALKKYFDGSETPRCNRITNAQKCIRTNDIENVGKTARHHTFFEMLGNFSIGDYFKEEAIQFAWEFLTSPEWIGFDKDKMYVTIYPDDEVAYNTWINCCKIDPSHILRTENNYWEIGEGPSGPCSEIFYDRGEKYDPEKIGERLFFDDMENDRYIEVWNVVFSQYDAKEGVDRKDYKELPQRNIDTGMGLERLVALVQDGETNFDTDLFLPMIHKVEKIAKYPYGGDYKMAYRVIADHIRTVTFALSDGALFSNEGRGYVLRRVLRRACRYGIKLGIQGAFMYQLVDTVVNNMLDFYPYLAEHTALVSKLVKIEEETFHSTLSFGEKLLLDELEKAKDTKVLNGDVVFKLYDTYGFPKELTTEIAQEKGYSVDMEGFMKEMNAQKERARNAREDEQSMSSQSIDLMRFTEPSTFIGYAEDTCSAVVIGCFKDGKKIDVISDEGEVILSQTVFYAESGGQVADSGTLSNDVMQASIIDVKKAPNNQHYHRISVKNGSLKVGDIVDCAIDREKRVKIKANHSSVHLLQSALKKIVGNHIHQAGSYVCDEYSRFDFTHYEKCTYEQLVEIELEVNKMIMHDNAVLTEIMSVDEAKTCGAIALFDEKYGDVVRVVSMGDVSKELCGGTHVSNTQEIGIFKIESEESIGSGVRRITAKTKLGAYDSFVDCEKRTKRIADHCKLSSVNALEEKVSSILEENAMMKKQLAKFSEKLLMLEADDVVKNAEEISGLNCLFIQMNRDDLSNLKGYGEVLRNKLENSVVFISNIQNEQVTFVCALSKKAIDQQLKAGDLVKMAATICNGNGGGRNDIAQSGGKDLSKIDEVFTNVKAKIQASL